MTSEAMDARRAAMKTRAEDSARYLDELLAKAMAEAQASAALRRSQRVMQSAAQQPPDLLVYFSNNLASVSRWLHEGCSDENGAPTDFQTLMDRQAEAPWTESHALSGSEGLGAWSRAANAGIPTVLGNGAVLMGFDGDVPLYNVGFNLESAQTISTAAVWPSGSTGFNLTGTNRTIYMWDGNQPRTTHIEFGGRVTSLDSGNGWYALHGTEIAGCLAAAGVNSAAKGMSCQGKVLAGFNAYDWFQMPAAISTNHMRLSNHSYGRLAGWWYDSTGGGWGWAGNSELNMNEDPKFGLYSVTTSNLDAIGYSALQYLGVWAAGNSSSNGPSTQPILHWETDLRGTARQTNSIHPNDGALTGGYDTLSEQACAKNVMTVGAIYAVTNGYMGPGSVLAAPSSSCGPTDDGRIKPDVVAPGVNILTTAMTSDSSYTLLSGTSMAAPAVTGSINLLAQLYSQLHTNSSDPLGSTFKALTIHTADQCGTNSGPSYQFGWGLMNTAKAASLMYQDATNGTKSFIKEVFLGSGKYIQFPILSSGGTNNPLKVTITWSDPPGTGSAQTNLNDPIPRLVNDLDLRVITPSGVTNFPYVLNPDLTNRSPAVRASGATTGDNSRDNVEQVCLTNPAAGTYIVSVAHKGVLQGGSQWVSIILSGNTPETAQQEFLIHTIVQTATNALVLGWPGIVGQTRYSASVI